MKSYPRILKLLEESNHAHYWMGFLIADGYFSFTHNAVVLTLAALDLNHLLRFKDFLQQDVKVGFWKKRNAYRINLHDRTNFHNLVTKYNIVPRKTYNPVPFYKVENDDQFLCMFIGFIDGDGHIGFSTTRRPANKKRPEYVKKTSKLVFEIHGSWLETARKIIERLNKIYNVELPVPYLNVDNLVIWSTTLTPFLRQLKLDVLRLNVPHLNRKWSRIDETKISYHEQYVKNTEIINHMISTGKTKKEIYKDSGLTKGVVKNFFRKFCSKDQSK